MNFPSYSVLIPAFNAEKSIGELLRQLQNIKNKPSHSIVIDDGSSDNTYAISSQYNAHVIKFDKNYGKGLALQKGFEIFKQISSDPYLICLDADLQHPTGSIEKFLEKARDEKSPVIIGKREIRIGKMPFLRYLSNKITSYILSGITEQNIQDSQCGFRLISRDIMNDTIFKENGFQFESEFIIRCAEKNIPIKFVDIPTIYNSHHSSINHVGDTIRFIKLVIREIFKK